MFSNLSTQWRFSGMGVRTGLDYASLEPTARLLDIELNTDTFAKLQTLERALIKADIDKHADKNRSTQS